MDELKELHSQKANEEALELARLKEVVKDMPEIDGVKLEIAQLRTSLQRISFDAMKALELTQELRFIVEKGEIQSNHHSKVTDKHADLLEDIQHFLESARPKIEDLEPFLMLKTERIDVLKGLVMHVFDKWEEQHAFKYIKKADAEQEFSFFRNEIQASGRSLLKFEKNLEYLRENCVTHTEFTDTTSKLINR